MGLTRSDITVSLGRNLKQFYHTVRILKDIIGLRFFFFFGCEIYLHVLSQGPSIFK